MERAVIAISALILNAIFCGPRPLHQALGLISLARLPSQWLRDIERKLNREHRSAKERQMRGAVVVVVLLLGSLLAGWILGALFMGNMRFFEMLLLALLLPVRQSWDFVFLLKKYLESGEHAHAHSLFDDTPWRYHALLDDYGMARAGAETLAIHFGEKILSPLFWYMLLGLPGLLAVKTITVMEENFSASAGLEPHFYQATRLVHHVIHFLPSRLAALFWLAASYLSPLGTQYRPGPDIFRAMMQETPHVLLLQATAATVGLSLGGPSSIYARDRWIGNGTPKATALQLKRGLFLYVLATLFLFSGLGFFL